MGSVGIDGLQVTGLKVIPTDGGDVKHALKASDRSFVGFGEAYFSCVETGAIKGWKKHKRMTLNVIVPQGAIKFVIYDDRDKSPTKGRFQEVVLGDSNYKRLTIPPMLWVGFMGIDKNCSLLLNVADLEHDFSEAERLDLENIYYPWEGEQ